MKLNFAFARPYSCHICKLTERGVYWDSGLAHLGFIESLLFDFLVEGFGDGGFLENTVLAVEKPVLEGEFREGEAYDEALPWEERPVEPAGQALRKC
jgi:hypothetical protein